MPPPRPRSSGSGRRRVAIVVAVGDTAENDAQGPLPRLGVRERKAFETRRRLLATALDLIAREGPDGVTIGVLADRSDIAVGTFYNYFPSREAIIDTVIDLEIGAMGRRLDALSSAVADPVNAHSAALRDLVRAAIADPVWGWFLVRLGVESEAAFQILGERLVNSITRGAEANRFLVSDVSTVSEMTIGALLAATRVFLLAERPAGDAASFFAEHHLRALGIPAEEAARIAVRKLPELPVIADQGALSIVRIAL